MTDTEAHHGDRALAIARAAEAVDRLQDAIAAGTAKLAADHLHAVAQLHGARKAGVTDKEINAARRDGGQSAIYVTANRDAGERPRYYLAADDAREYCEAQVHSQYPGSELTWGCEEDDEQARAAAPWLLFRNDDQGDLIDTTYTVAPLLTPPEGGRTDDRTEPPGR